MKRNAAHNGDTDSESPVSVLVETKDLSGKGHPQSHQEQKYANDPGQLARKLVGAEKDHLAHVDQDDCDHEVGTPAMHGAQEPSQSDIVVEILQAVPGFTRRRNINQRQHNAGEYLQDEKGERGTAEDVPPARRFSRDRMGGRVTDRTSDLQPLLEPVPDLL